MFLQVMSLAGDINGRFAAIGKAHAGDLSQGRVWLFRGHRADDEADALLEAVFLQNGRFAERPLLAARFADELVDRRHALGIGFYRELSRIY